MDEKEEEDEEKEEVEVEEEDLEEEDEEISLFARETLLWGESDEKMKKVSTSFLPALQ